jgi:hypothetical protein
MTTTMSVNEWRDAVRARFTHVRNGRFEVAPHSVFCPIPHVNAVDRHGAKLGQWFEGGSFWIGDLDPDKCDSVGRSAEYSRVEDLT